MTFRQMFVRTAAAAAAVAAVIALLPGVLTTASAQQAAPFTAYGVGLQSGQVVEVFDGSASCGSVTADGSGQWLIQISATSPCAPREGDTLSFTLDGASTSARETFKTGGAPADVANGITLTVVATATPTPTPGAGPGTFAGSISAHGITPAVFNGGTVDQAVTAAGSGLNSIWSYNGGVAVGYTVGAPAFVNQAFLALFPGGAIPPGQILILVKP